MDSTRVWEEISKEQRRLLEGKDSGKFLGVADVQLFLKTLARDASGEKFLRDHEKLAYRQNRVYSHRRPFR